MFFSGFWSDAGRPHTNKLVGLAFGIPQPIVQARAPNGKRERCSPGGMSRATGRVFFNQVKLGGQAPDFGVQVLHLALVVGLERGHRGSKGVT